MKTLHPLKLFPWEARSVSNQRPYGSAVIVTGTIVVLFV